MEILLRQDVEGLGASGEIVNVADGYGRNFLIPRKIGVKPTEANAQHIEREKQKEIRKKADELGDLKQFAEKVSGISCTVPVKVGEEGQMYGSVTPQDIAAAMKNEDVEIDPKSIVLDDPIKELGVYSFTVHFAPEVEATSKVWVVED
jgi:large subunit ribosomal protein L9